MKKPDQAGGVVLVKEPQIDKIAARAVLQRFLGYPLPVVAMWSSNEEPSEEVFQGWVDSNIIPIDLGRDKYHTRGTHSALESVVVDYEIPRDMALEELLTVINKNNLTGFLKGFFGSVAWTLRELYKLGRLPAAVIEATDHVIGVFLDAFDQPAKPGEAAILGGLITTQVGKDFLKGNYGPFTVARYMRDMWRLGLPVEEIIRRAKYWSEGWLQARNMRASTQDQLLVGEGFEVSQNLELGSGRLGVVKTDSPYISREVVKEFLVVIVRNSKGNVRIQTNNSHIAYLQGLARELIKLEPALWFYDPRLLACLNGTRQYEVKPTGLSDDQLVELVKQHVRFTVAKRQQTQVG